MIAGGRQPYELSCYGECAKSLIFNLLNETNLKLYVEHRFDDQKPRQNPVQTDDKLEAKFRHKFQFLSQDIQTSAGMLCKILLSTARRLAMKEEIPMGLKV